MRLLVTGFGPFPGIPRNPSAALAGWLGADRRLRRLGITVIVRLLPTTYADVSAMVPAIVADLQPDAVLMFGVASRRKHLSIEVRAANRASVLHPDAAGFTPKHRALAIGEPAFLAGRAPFEAITIAARRCSLPTRPSRNAGGYLCNAGYWMMLSAMPAEKPCLFLHIPKLRTRALAARMRNAAIATALLLGKAARH